MNSVTHANIAAAYLTRLSTDSLQMILNKEIESKRASAQLGMNAQIAAQESVAQAIETGVGKISWHDLDIIELIVKQQMLSTLADVSGLYSINGRVMGDSDDTHHIVEAGGEVEAKAMYVEQMQFDCNGDQDTVVFVNSCVLLSKAIEDRIT